ncbi:MAG: DUF192 domain-containing protein [Patescibacteria group bacterium]|nr:DUF192 domain-containing protein [Patescibacteria group bacterium]
MQSTAKKIITVIFLLAALIAIAFAIEWFGRSLPANGSPVENIAQPSKVADQSSSTGNDMQVVSIKAPGGVIHAMVASTSAEQERGLGGRSSILVDQGMLFPFRYPGDYGFWMKDMSFPLDMVWISSDKKVSGVTPGISADSYPEVFYPPVAISYVLELNSGGAAAYGIATDTQLVF